MRVRMCNVVIFFCFGTQLTRIIDTKEEEEEEKIQTIKRNKKIFQ